MLNQKMLPAHLLLVAVLASSAHSTHAQAGQAVTNSAPASASAKADGAGADPNAAASPPPAPSTAGQMSKGKLLEAIETDARRDGASGRPALTIDEMEKLYGADAQSAGVSMREVRAAYTDAYKSARDAQPVWVRLRPSAGWLAFFGLLVVSAIHLLWKDTIYPRVKNYNDLLMGRLSGYSLFHGRAVRKYKEHLEDKNKRFRPPLLSKSDLELEMKNVYVPLQVRRQEGHGEGPPVDALEAITRNQRLMITGKPGSGKSMLLKSYCLTFAEAPKQPLPATKLPILYELRKHNEDDRPLFDQFVGVMAENGFKNAGNFLDNALESGNLILLFDGLDEVNSAKRVKVIENVKNFLNLYKDCWAVITCRTAVYNNEFNAVVNQTLEIEPFSDQNIQNFLGTWKPTLPGKSPVQLWLTISERPKIKELARNPLLLTMIAFLYNTSQVFELPYSRAEFYESAVDLLLRLNKLRNQSNTYSVPQKRIVLGHLALFNQDSGALGDQDRISMDYKTVIKGIKKVLPDLGRSEEEAPAILEEIKEQSGLLMPIDGGSRFQFSHLTLQEYFTAAELQNDEDGLIERFRRDPDAWRETVLLWSGIRDDSTDLIKKLRGEFPLIAFECLADAKKVAPAIAGNIIAQFKPELGREQDTDAITQAFAAVAAGPDQRNQEVFNFLVDTLYDSSNLPRRSAAIRALSLTNKPAAAERLGKVAIATDEIRKALVRMGDLAVPGLSRRVEDGDLQSLADLRRIGTPQAARALINHLWSDDVATQVRAATYLSGLFPQRNVLDELRQVRLEDWQRDGRYWYPFVWEPFEEPVGSPIPVIAGRIAYILDNYAENLPDEDSADVRIILPLVARRMAGRDVNRQGIIYDIVNTQFFGDFMRELGREKSSLRLNSLFRSPESFGDVGWRVVYAEFESASLAIARTPAMNSQYVSLLLEHLGDEYLDVLKKTSPDNAINYIIRWLGPKPIQFSQWKLVTTKPFVLDSSWQYVVCVILLALLGVAAEVKIMSLLPASQGYWLALYAYCAFTIISGCIFFLTGFPGADTPDARRLRPTVALVTVISFLYPVLLGYLAVIRLKGEKDEGPPLKMHLALAACLGFGPAIFYFSDKLLAEYLSPYGALAFWVAFLALIAALLAHCYVKYRRNVNPLRDVLLSSFEASAV